MPDRPVYIERTWAPAWVFILLWGACIVGAVSLVYGLQAQESSGQALGATAPPSWALAVAGVAILLVPLAVTVLLGRLDTEIWHDRLLVAFGPARVIRRVVPYGNIESVEAVTYRPIRDFGGWGIRFRPGKSAWTIRGDRAVRLGLLNGRALYIGSRFPHRLAERILVAKQKRERKATS